ncbi:MAG: hypothetical protein AB7T63_11510 [Planctomycetota bacterium]
MRRGVVLVLLLGLCVVAWRLLPSPPGGGAPALPDGREPVAAPERAPALAGVGGRSGDTEAASTAAEAASTASEPLPEGEPRVTIATTSGVVLSDARVLSCPCTLPVDWPTRTDLGRALDGYAWPGGGRHLVFTATHATVTDSPGEGGVVALAPLASVTAVWADREATGEGPPDTLRLELDGLSMDVPFEAAVVPVPAVYARAAALRDGVVVDRLAVHLEGGRGHRLEFVGGPRVTVTIVATSSVPTTAESVCSGTFSTEVGADWPFTLLRHDEHAFRGEVTLPQGVAGRIAVDLRDGAVGAYGSVDYGPRGPTQVELPLRPTRAVRVAYRGPPVRAQVMLWLTRTMPDFQFGIRNFHMVELDWGKDATLWLAETSWNPTVELLTGSGAVRVPDVLQVGPETTEIVLESLGAKPTEGTRFDLRGLPPTWTWTWGTQVNGVGIGGPVEGPFFVPLAFGPPMELRPRHVVLRGESASGVCEVRFELRKDGPPELTLDARQAVLGGDPAQLDVAQLAAGLHLGSHRLGDIIVRTFVTMRSAWTDVPVFLYGAPERPAEFPTGLKLLTRSDGDVVRHTLERVGQALPPATVPFLLEAPGAEGLRVRIEIQDPSTGAWRAYDVICGQQTHIELPAAATHVSLRTMAGVPLGQAVDLDALGARPDDHAALEVRAVLEFASVDDASLRGVRGAVLEDGGSAVPLLLSRCQAVARDSPPPRSEPVVLRFADGRSERWDAADLPILVLDLLDGTSVQWVAPDR